MRLVLLFQILDPTNGRFKFRLLNPANIHSFQPDPRKSVRSVAVNLLTLHSCTAAQLKMVCSDYDY
jgi:hypothetical protein